MKCKVRSCQNKKYGLGYCIKHYKRFRRNGDPLITLRERHGMSESREYSSWHMMKERCLNKNSKQYHNYGGRGIKIFKPWIDSFSTFFNDMGKRPKNTSLDRIDNNGNYEPNNCRWATSEQQNNNQRLRSDNTSGYAGVSWYKPSKKWKAQITIDGVVKNLGHFEDKEEAREVYLKAKEKKQVW